MTEKEIISIIKTLKAYYPYYYKGITAEEAKEVVSIWKIHFEEYDYELIKKVIDYWGGRNSAPPTIADIKTNMFYFYTEYNEKYSELIKSETPDLNEIAKIDRIKKQIWASK